MRHLILGIAIMLLACSPAFAADPSTPALNEAVRNVLKENPELILDVLRENSAAVLEIAQQGLRDRQSKVIVAQWKTELTGEAKTINTKRPTRGTATAPVIVTVYSDFTCPFCEQGAALMQALLKKYDGKIGYIFKYFPAKGSDIPTIAAQYSIAAFMQDEAKGWKFYDALYARRELLIQQGEQLLKLTALEIGLDLNRLAQDIKGKQVAATLASDLAEAATVGIKGTPYFLIGNKLVVAGVLPEDLVSQAIDMALEDATKKK